MDLPKRGQVCALLRQGLSREKMAGRKAGKFLFRRGVKEREELAALTATVCDKFAFRYLGGS